VSHFRPRHHIDWLEKAAQDQLADLAKPVQERTKK